MIKARSGDDRRGMSIIETVVVMSGVAVALGLATLLIQIMLRLGSDDQARLTVSAALERFSRGFRSDAHAAARVKVENDGAVGRLILEVGPGSRVEYRPKGSLILREQSRAGRFAGRDECVLARGASATFESRLIAGREFVVLVVHPPADKTGSTAAPLEILASVGKDQGRGETPRKGAP